MSAPDANGWMPIESAAQDEKLLVLLFLLDGRTIVGRYDYTFEGMAVPQPKWATVDWNRVHPTHWQPLPGKPRNMTHTHRWGSVRSHGFPRASRSPHHIKPGNEA
jgi:hypothetical protein